MKKIINLALLTSIIVFTGCADKSVRQPKPIPVIKQSIDMKKSWHKDVGAYTWDRYLRLTPAFYADTLYVADRKGYLFSIDSKSGKTIYKKKLRKKFTSDIGVGKQYILIGTHDATLVVINRKTGEIIRELELTNEVISAPIVHQGKAIIKSIDGVVTTFDIKTGKKIWEHKEVDVPSLSLRVGSSPIVKNEKVYVGFSNGQLVALALSTGEVAWRKLITDNKNFALDDIIVDIDINPKLYHSDLYIAGMNSNLISLDTNKNSFNWKKKISTFSGLDVDRASVIVIDNDGVIYCYRRSNGRLVWRQESLKFRDLTGPTMYKGKVFFADKHGYLYAISQATGNFLAMTKVHKTGVVSNLIVKNDMVFVKANNGYMTAYFVK